MTCPVCGNRRIKTHQATVLNKHQVDYWRCEQCEFWGTETPTWLDEAYSSAITATDTGLVTRNLYLARRLPLLLLRLNPSRTARYVDWAGGYGLFVRLMRDAGFDFEWQDDYADNLFARDNGFSKSEDPISAVTAFEVFEHVEDPMAFVKRILDSTKCETLIFTTDLHSASYDVAWPYLAPETGQHISFYSRKTLSEMGRILKLNVYSHAGIHMLTTKNLRFWEFNFTIDASRYAVPCLRLNRKSLTWTDHEQAVRHAQGGRGLINARDQSGH